MSSPFVMSQGSQSEPRRGTYPYLATSGPKPAVQHSQLQNSHPDNFNASMAAYGPTGGHMSSSQVGSRMWAAPLPSAQSLPRIVPNSSSNGTNYMPYISYNMDGLVVSPPLAPTTIPSQKSLDVDAYHPPPLSTTPVSHSSTGSRPLTGGSPTGRLRVVRVQSPAKKRKSGEGKLPTFLVRLYEILKEPKYPKLLSWDETGQFIVAHTSDPQLLEVLKSEYNQNRVASFTRQLNIYGWMRDNISRNTESTEPTLWRHQSLNRESTLDDLLATVRRVAPRTSQAEKRRKMEEEGGRSPKRLSIDQGLGYSSPWMTVSPTDGQFALGVSSPVDASFRHHRHRTRRYSNPEGAPMETSGGSTPRFIPGNIPLQSSTDGRMLSQSAPNSGASFTGINSRASAGLLQSVPAMPSSDILANPGIRYLATTHNYFLPLNRSTNQPLQHQINDPSTWSRHGIATLGHGMKPFSLAPLASNSPETPITSLNNGFQTALNIPHTPTSGGSSTFPPPRVTTTQQGSPKGEEEIIVTPPPAPSQSLRQATVVPGAYMGILNAPATPASPWAPSSSVCRSTNGPVRSEVLAPRSSSVLQRVMHGQSGLSFVPEEEGDPLPSSILPQPRLFDDIEQ